MAEELLSLEKAATHFPVFDIWETSISQQPPAFVSWITQHYQNWAKANFGPEKSDEIGALLAMADRLGEPKYTGDGIKDPVLSISSKFPQRIGRRRPEELDGSEVLRCHSCLYAVLFL